MTRSNDVSKWAARSAALAQMGAGLGVELADVVERMHGSIAQLPSPLAELEREHTRGITGFVYGWVKTSMSAAHWGLRHAASSLSGLDQDDEDWMPVRAAINGVCGDALADQANPLAIEMAFEGEQAADRADSNTLLLFVHGLCMSEHGWQEPSHLMARSRMAEQLNARIAYLRYNTGLHMSENGERLAEMLEAYTEGDQRIVIVGHSMGGLVTRSACHYAQQAGHQWQHKLSHVVCLGTPHNGAPLERLGNFANTMLKTTPYTKPLARLGNIRSAGICDLRHGNLLHSDWREVSDPDHYDDCRTPVPLLPEVNYLLVAGTRSQDVPENPFEAKHDLLVTVASAWAQSHKPSRSLAGDNIQRELLASTNHMDLLWDAKVYHLVSEWLASSAKAEA